MVDIDCTYLRHNDLSITVLTDRDQTVNLHSAAGKLIKRAELMDKRATDQ